MRHLIAVPLLLVACGGSVPKPLAPAETRGERPSPLGRSYTLNPLPSDDDSLLGRILEAPPSDGQSLEEVARPNPCADKLGERRMLPSLATFEDAEELSMSGKASATLGTFGFSGDASRATHFVYKLQTEKRLSVVDTPEYEACCAENNCGYGFVSALVYGSGEYATGEETSGSAGANVTFAKAEGSASLRILHRRAVRGWVAAMIRLTDEAKTPATAIGMLGDPAAAGIKLDEATLSGQVKERFDAEKISLEPVPGTRPESAYKLRDAAGPIEENEFIRRYRAIVGPSELDELEGMRHKGRKLVPLSVLVASVAALGVGIPLYVTAVTYEGSDKDRYTPHFIVGTGLLALGGVGLPLGITFTAVGFSGDDTDDHRISKFDAELYTQRYNRAILRKVVRESEERMRSLQGRATEIDGARRALAHPTTPTLHVTPFGVFGAF